MTHDRPVPPVDGSPSGDDRNRGASIAADRRSCLRMIGATAAVTGGLLGPNSVSGADDGTRASSRDVLRLGDDAGDSAGEIASVGRPTEPEIVEIDYDDYYDPTVRYNGLADVYRVWNVRSQTDPEITGDRSFVGDYSVAHHLDGDQMTANTVYPVGTHHGDEVEELHQRFYVHPDGMCLSEFNTMRFFWLGLRNGPESSGGGWSPPHSGTDGWSVRAGFTRRQDHGHPDTYTFFVYSYDMRLSDHDIPSIEYGTHVQVPMDEWVSVESYQKLNSYDANGPNWDGELRVWVNDDLAYEHDSLAWRSTAGQGIQEVGPHGYDLYRDNDPHTIYFDDHRIAVGGTLDD